MTIQRVPRKKALSIAVSYKKLQKAYPDYPDPLHLPGSRRDSITIQKMLIDTFGYKEEDITLLIDDGKHLEPTYEHIVQGMKDLVADAQPSDHFVFHFSGHGYQIPNLDGTEEDGLDEVIWPADVKLVRDTQDSKLYKPENYIIDDDIHDILVGNLPEGAHLVTIFDCCTSGTAADLPCRCEDNCSQSPCAASANEEAIQGKIHARAINHHIQREGIEETIVVSPANRAVTMQKSLKPQKQAFPFVTSWSACMDGDVAWETNKSGGLFIDALAKALKQKPNQTHKELLHSVTAQIVQAVDEARKSPECKETELSVPRPQLSGLLDTDTLHDLPFTL